MYFGRTNTYDCLFYLAAQQYTHRAIMAKEDLRVTRDPRYHGRLSPIELPSDVPDRWKGTPIEALINSHNFDTEIETSGNPELVIATCIEFRYQPKVPASFAYMLRRASGRLNGSEFSLAYTLAKGVRHLALVGHNDCGMAKVADHKESMINALVEQGWYRDRAEEYVTVNASRYAISDELSSLKNEYLRLRRLFHKLEIAPLFLSLANSKIYLPGWYFQMIITGEVDKPVGAETLVRDDDLLTLL